MSMIVIDKEKCVGCTLCVPACPFAAIEMRDNKAVVLENCTLCKACIPVCKFDAISLQEDEVTFFTEDTESYTGVWVFGEHHNGEIQSVVYELIGEGRKLADKLGQELAVVVLGHDIAGQAEALLEYPVDKVYYVDHESFAKFQDDPYSTCMAELSRRYKPNIILTGATSVGRSFIPQVAVKLRTGLTADCTGLDIEDETGLLLQTRPAFGGNIMATIKCRRHRPQMATVRHKVMKPAEKCSEKAGEFISVDYSPDGKITKARLVESVDIIEETVNLTEADIIVSGGRGLGDPKNFELIERLAKALGGAVGASRAAVDADWIPYSHQVGQTGKTVCPKLYIACGISGQVQHLAGMKSSDVIVAINKDPDAPIFEHATYGIVGDLFKIIPALIKRFENA